MHARTDLHGNNRDRALAEDVAIDTPNCCRVHRSHHHRHLCHILSVHNTSIPLHHHHPVPGLSTLHQFRIASENVRAGQKSTKLDRQRHQSSDA